MIANAKKVCTYSAANSAATTTNASSVTKGTATDLALTVHLDNFGTTSLAGTWTFQLQGTNDGSTYTNVSADKGALQSASSVAGDSTAHYAQLQYKGYRVQAVTGTTTTGSFVAVYDFQNLADSFDDTVA